MFSSVVSPYQEPVNHSITSSLNWLPVLYIVNAKGIRVPAQMGQESVVPWLSGLRRRLACEGSRVRFPVLPTPPPSISTIKEDISAFSNLNIKYVGIIKSKCFTPSAEGTCLTINLLVRSDH